MLPQDVLDIIETYVTQFDMLESLPEIASIQKLVTKSNHSLIMIATQLVGIPLALVMEIALTDSSIPFLVDIDISRVLSLELNQTIMFSMNANFATSSLFWLFILREPNIYHGPYSALFENSLLFKMVNLITAV